jgi:hypothetical protein
MCRLLSHKDGTAQAIAYSATSFSTSVLSGVFTLYYVDLFLSVYKLDEWWFNFGQVRTACVNEYAFEIMDSLAA